MTVVASKYALKENDLYETEEWAVFAVIRALKALGLWRNGTFWEPSAGNHRLVRPLFSSGAKTVITSDIAVYNEPHTFLLDFLGDEEPDIDLREFDLVTNPPYGHRNMVAHRYVERALDRCNGVIALLLTAKFDSGSTRTHMFRDNPRFRAKITLIDRISWEGNGATGTEDHAWYVWGSRDAKPEKTELLYQGNPSKRGTGK